jgi:DNA topoisomerase-1
MELIAQKSFKGPRAVVAPLRDLGLHPSGGPIHVMEGRYGPYVKWEKVNATLPKGVGPEDVTLEMALELIAAKGPAKGKKKAPARKPAAQKPAAKKPVKKTAAKK